MNFSLPAFWEHFDPPHGEIETEVLAREGSYKNLSPQALYTSREDFLAIFAHPEITGTFVDLGCGAGEGCLIYGSLFPERGAIGLEFEASRLTYGQNFRDQHHLNNVTFYLRDLLTDPIPEGDIYFLYFPTGMILDRVLSELYKFKNQFKLVAIESHGDLFARLDLENWLTLTDEVKLHSPRHHPCARIYQRNSSPRRSEALIFDLSFQHRYLLLEDLEQRWIGSSFGFQWTALDRFELLTPPRTIFWKDVVAVLTWDDLAPEVKTMVSLWEEKEIEILTSAGTLQGCVRKIIVHPSFHLELSSGEKVEWVKILSIKKGSVLCYEHSP